MNSQQRRKQRRRFCHRVSIPWSSAIRYNWEIDDWCKRRMGKHKYLHCFRNNAYEFWFDNQSNAMLFALNWLGETA